MRGQSPIVLAAMLMVYLGSPALADDVVVQLDADDGFVLQDSAGTPNELLRIDEATGDISRNGLLLFLADTPATRRNTILGLDAGSNLAASGVADNTGVGYQALRDLTTGDGNTAVGKRALTQATSGSRNVALGYETLEFSGGSDNVAIGYRTLGNGTTGSRNIAIGKFTALNVTTDDNIYIGSGTLSIGGDGHIVIGESGVHTDTRIHGIFGATVTGSNVVVNSIGQLGVASSSLRFKEAVGNMGDASEVLMELRPVSFRYREEHVRDRAIQYGLIAEEVAGVAPALVQLDREGRPYTVRYQLLTPMLLNEFQKQQRTIESQAAVIDHLITRLERLEAEVGRAVR